MADIMLNTVIWIPMRPTQEQLLKPIVYYDVMYSVTDEPYTPATFSSNTDCVSAVNCFCNLFVFCNCALLLNA